MIEMFSALASFLTILYIWAVLPEPEPQAIRKTF